MTYLSEFGNPQSIKTQPPEPQYRGRELLQSESGQKEFGLREINAAIFNCGREPRGGAGGDGERSAGGRAGGPGAARRARWRGGRRATGAAEGCGSSSDTRTHPERRAARQDDRVAGGDDDWPIADWKNWEESLPVFVDAGDPAKHKAVASPRPGHADLAGSLKYDFPDARYVLERASARETAARVACGAMAKMLLRELGVEVASHVVRVGKAELRREASGRRSLRSRRRRRSC